MSTTPTAHIIIADLLAHPYPHDLLEIRARVRDDWYGDEEEAKIRMESYCTEKYALAAREEHGRAVEAARAYLQRNAEPVTTYTLEELHSMPKDARPADALKVRIYSREHNAWWRTKGCGYTTDRTEAGVYTFGEAWTRSGHAGPEKGIEYEVLP